MKNNNKINNTSSNVDNDIYEVVDLHYGDAVYTGSKQECEKYINVNKSDVKDLGMRNSNMKDV